jgi:hypothetical protein
LNTAIARPAATPARISSENPPPIAMPVIAAETASAETASVMPINAMKNEAKQPSARIGATPTIRIAINVTPVGRFIALRRPWKIS